MNVVPIGSTVPLDLLIADSTGGVTGQSPVLILQRKSDNYYWNGTGFQASLISLSMTEVDAVNQKGLYTRTFSNQGGDQTANSYVIYYTNSNPSYPGNAVDEIIFTNQVANVNTLAIAQAVAAKILVNPAVPIDSEDIASQTTLLEVQTTVNNIANTAATEATLDAFRTEANEKLDQILGIVQPQIGNSLVTFTILDQSDVPVEGVRVTVMNSTMTANIATGTTNINGQLILGLPASSPDAFQVTFFKTFYTFGTQPLAITTLPNTPLAVAVTATSFQPASSIPNVCACYCYLMDASGNPVVGEMVRAKLVSDFPFSPGTSMLATKTNMEVFSDSSGFVTLNLIQGGMYEINSPSLYITITNFRVPAQASLDLSTLLQYNS